MNYTCKHRLSQIQRSFDLRYLRDVQNSPFINARLTRLMALVFCSGYFSPISILSPVLAQETIRTAIQKRSLPTHLDFGPVADQADVDLALTWVAQENLCRIPISLKVTNASLHDIAVQVQAALSNKTPIEVRPSEPANFAPANLTLDLQNTPAWKILQGRPRSLTAISTFLRTTCYWHRSIS